METSKHTAGNWTFKPSGDANFYFLKLESKPNSWLMNIQQNGELSNEEQIANIELITEASSVANETGKTPKQLADENKELTKALIEAKKELMNHIMSLKNESIFLTINNTIDNVTK